MQAHHNTRMYDVANAINSFSHSRMVACFQIPLPTPFEPTPCLTQLAWRARDMNKILRMPQIVSHRTAQRCIDEDGVQEHGVGVGQGSAKGAQALSIVHWSSSQRFTDWSSIT